MAAISVRGLEAQQLQDLKNEARRQGISLNKLALQRLTGSGDNAAAAHDDLDALAGTWSQNEADAFNAAIAPLEQVDPELWE
jgi:ABC-type uncharacterized transport system substrate-binding protein